MWKYGLVLLVVLLSTVASDSLPRSTLITLLRDLKLDAQVVDKLEEMGLDDAFLIGEAAVSTPEIIQSILEKVIKRPGDALRLLLACKTAYQKKFAASPNNYRVGEDQTVGVKTFGTVVCNSTEVEGPGGSLPEVTVYEYTISDTATTAAITHWQFTANGTYQPWTIRFYVDGEVVASLKFNFWMEGKCNSCGWGLLLDPNTPWGVSKIGKGSAWGGLYNNMRVPFGKSVRMTVQADKFAYFFSIIRGAENVPIIAGGLVLPPQARLRIYAQEDYTIKPLGYLPVLNSTSQGVLAMWTMVIMAPNLNFLEACTRVWIDGQPMYFIGDGEDFFDSAWYFNGGTYTFPQAGLTYGCGGGGLPLCPDGTAVISAYRIFDDDPIVWHDSAYISWRNGETSPAPGVKCMAGNDGGPPIGAPGLASVFSYAWVYEW